MVAKWNHPVARDGRVAIIAFLAGILEHDEGLRLQLLEGMSIKITFTWTKVYLTQAN